MQVRKVFLSVAAVAVVIGACSPGTSTQSTSNSDSSLVVYSGRSYEYVEPLFEQFTKDTGIDVELRMGDTAEMAAQILEEGDASPADVFYGQDAGALGALDDAGRCAQLPDEVSNRVPGQYRSSDGTWVGITGRARTIVYDSSQLGVEDVPDSVFDLVDPQWRGQVAIAPPNGSFQAFVTGMRRAVGDEATEAWLRGLIENDVQLFEKNTPILEAVDSGSVQLGLVNHYYWYEKAAEVGAENMNAQQKFTKPGDPGTLVNVSGACVLNSASNPEAGEALIAWMLSEETQQFFVDTTFEYPLIPEVAGPVGVPGLGDVQGPDVPLADLDDLAGTLQMLQGVGLT